MTFEETKAPEGYLINDEVIVRQVAASGSGQTDTLFQIPRIADHVIRGHIQIVKFQEAVDPEQEQKLPLSGIRFSITSKATGKRRMKTDMLPPWGARKKNRKDCLMIPIS